MQHNVIRVSLEIFGVPPELIGWVMKLCTNFEVEVKVGNDAPLLRVQNHGDAARGGLERGRHVIPLAADHAEGGGGRIWVLAAAADQLLEPLLAPPAGEPVALA